MADPGIWNQEPPEELANLAANFNKSFPSSYDFAKTFVQTASSAAGGGNGVTSLDDPTYLGFNVRFEISSPLFDGALAGNPAIAAGAAKTALDEVATNESQGEGTHPSGESAVGYLNQIGEVTRATYLKAFCQGIREIQTTRPYYFQTIEGLQEAFNKTVNMTPYGGSADGEGITVGCLEAIDLKMSALFNLYKSACYDVKYRRNVLPINLMYFTCYVDVVEIRKFKSVRNFINSLNPLSPEPQLSKFVNENASKITLKFSECVWDAGASGQVFANVSNDGSGGMATSSIKWSYGNVEIQSQFAGYDSALVDSANLQPKTFGDLAKAAGQKLLDKQITGAENFIQRKALGFLNSLNPLNNVYGKLNQAINVIQNPQGLISSLQGALVQEETTPGFNKTLDGNVYDDGVTLGASSQSLSSINIIRNNEADPLPLSTSNIFTPQPSGPPLNRTNIFE